MKTIIKAGVQVAPFALLFFYPEDDTKKEVSSQ